MTLANEHSLKASTPAVSPVVLVLAVNQICVSPTWKAPSGDASFPRLFTRNGEWYSVANDYRRRRDKHAHQLHVSCVCDACSRKNPRGPVNWKSPWKAEMRLYSGLEYVCRSMILDRSKRKGLMAEKGQDVHQCVRAARVKRGPLAMGEYVIRT
jgi:hypothetical protein